MSLVRKGVSLATAAASQSNGQRSHGPATPAGQTRSRCNALKHWGRAESMRRHLPALGEEAAEYDRVRAALYRSLRPEDEFESLLVDDMAEVRWRLGRVIGAETAVQAKRRRERQARREQKEAFHAEGKLDHLEPQIAERLGLAGLDDSPEKFARILLMLRWVHAYVQQEGFGEEGGKLLELVYGDLNQGLVGQGLITCYKELVEEEKSGAGEPEPRAADFSSSTSSL